MRGTRGFTLIELLVVVAILAVLVGMLFPAFGKVRHAALAAKDLTNLRNMQMAHVGYINDNKGRFIDVGLGHGGSDHNAQVSWFNTLQEYYQNELLLRSPLDTSPHWSLSSGGAGQEIPGWTEEPYRFRRTSYGMNAYLSETLAPIYLETGDRTDIYARLTKVKSPVNTVQFMIMAFEGEYAGADHVHPEGWAPAGVPNDVAPGLAASQIQTNAVGGPERSWDSKTNYGFLDGHVETARFGQVFVNAQVNRFDPSVSSSYAATMASASSEAP
jgi:prepilin-type N-terminal cleavage/methylation domain-containing protein/prepilin-type processing-associated H-X9-DG protein